MKLAISILAAAVAAVQANNPYCSLTQDADLYPVKCSDSDYYCKLPIDCSNGDPTEHTHDIDGSSTNVISGVEEAIQASAPANAGFALASAAAVFTTAAAAAALC